MEIKTRYSLGQKIWVCERVEEKPYVCSCGNCINGTLVIIKGSDTYSERCPNATRGESRREAYIFDATVNEITLTVDESGVKVRRYNISEFGNVDEECFLSEQAAERARELWINEGVKYREEFSGSVTSPVAVGQTVFMVQKGSECDHVYNAKLLLQDGSLKSVSVTSKAVRYEIVEETVVSVYLDLGPDGVSAQVITKEMLERDDSWHTDGYFLDYSSARKRAEKLTSRKFGGSYPLDRDAVRAIVKSIDMHPTVDEEVEDDE